MSKKNPQINQQEVWLKRLDSVTLKGVNLAKHWLPKGAALVEKKTRIATKNIHEYQQKKQQAATRAPRKSRLLWLLPLPLIPATMMSLASGQFVIFLANLIASGLFLASALLTRKGFEQEVTQPRQQFQASTEFPFKTFGASTLALATFVTAWGSVNHNLAISLAFGVGAFAAFVLLYGLDSRKQNTVVNTLEGDHQEVTEALQKAEQKIHRIELAQQQISDPELKQRLTRITTLGRDILAEIARNPKSLQRARKFLNVYLKGTKRVVDGYTKANKRNQAHPLENNFRRVLITIEDVFNKQYQRLQEKDLHELDIQIEVLEMQLKHEGLG